MVFPKPASFPTIIFDHALLLKATTKSATTPRLWNHKRHPVQFCLIVDNFGVKYIGVEHFNHLFDLLKNYHGVQVNMMGDELAGMDIKWD